MIHTQHARLVDMLLMCAVRIAFIEDNINLTLNFHLIFFFFSPFFFVFSFFSESTHGLVSALGCLSFPIFFFSRPQTPEFKLFFFSSHILPPSGGAAYYTYKTAPV